MPPRRQRLLGRSDLAVVIDREAKLDVVRLRVGRQVGGAGFQQLVERRRVAAHRKGRESQGIHHVIPGLGVRVEGQIPPVDTEGIGPKEIHTGGVQQFLQTGDRSSLPPAISMSAPAANDNSGTRRLLEDYVEAVMREMSTQAVAMDDVADVVPLPGAAELEEERSDLHSELTGGDRVVPLHPDNNDAFGEGPDWVGRGAWAFSGALAVAQSEPAPQILGVTVGQPSTRHVAAATRDRIRDLVEPLAHRHQLHSYLLAFSVDFLE